ncbi:hypothetical protein Pla22_23400 [Rubripirellula amarantea]|uniref:Uncharacterized protein n=2 Tax=Rubripirellula amarantea TaxID=2527999 RepID=A0A5C5WVV1_9BACT|nr:hypothetical protein Pla22_23400 [Rubripirellula amarantea]
MNDSVMFGNQIRSELVTSGANEARSAMHSQPTLWESSGYRVKVVINGVTSWIVPDRPYVLIGSADHCDITLEGAGKVPPVAYIVCCLRDRIEVWPTSAIAYSRWGALKPNDTIQVVNALVSVRLDSAETEFADDDPAPADSTRTEVLTAELACLNKKVVRKRFRRSVTIIGDRHPSTLRVRGQGLHRCHFAAVAQDSKIWIIDLSVGDQLPSQRIQLLDNADSVARMLDITIKLSDPVDVGNETRLPIVKRNMSRNDIEASEPSPNSEDEGASTTSTSLRRTDAGNQPFGTERTDLSRKLSSALTDRLIHRSRSWKKITLLIISLVVILLSAAFVWFGMLSEIYLDWF